MSSPAFSAGHFQAIKTKENAVIRDKREWSFFLVRDRSLFIIWAGEEYLGGDQLIRGDHS